MMSLSTLSDSSPGPAAYPKLPWWKQVMLASPPLWWTGVGLLLCSLPTALLVQLDPRLLQGVSVWLKPWKFQVSVGTYLLTLALFMAGLPDKERRGWWVGGLVWTAVVCGLLEVAYITAQGMRGVASHFNFSSPLSITLYNLMGVGAVLLTTSSLVLAVRIARSARYRAAPAVKLGVVLGLALTWVLGLGFGGYMGAQMAGHWVGGVATDAGGLPVVNWSRSGGDLRVPHFFGIHAMHFVPAVAWLITRASPLVAWARPLVWGAAVSFSVLTVATFVQARAGMPFLGSSHAVVAAALTGGLAPPAGTRECLCPAYCSLPAPAVARTWRSTCVDGSRL